MVRLRTAVYCYSLYSIISGSHGTRQVPHYQIVPILTWVLPGSFFWDLCSFVILCSIEWRVLTDILEQPIGSIFQRQAVILGLYDPWRWDQCFVPESVKYYHSVLYKYQNRADLIYTAAEAWNHKSNFLLHILHFGCTTNYENVPLILVYLSQGPLLYFLESLKFLPGDQETVDGSGDIATSCEFWKPSSIGSITTHKGWYYAKTTEWTTAEISAIPNYQFPHLKKLHCTPISHF
jgi:hypothetical protein